MANKSVVLLDQSIFFSDAIISIVSLKPSAL